MNRFTGPALAGVVAVLALAACTSSTSGNGASSSGPAGSSPVPSATGSPIPATSTPPPSSAPAPSSVSVAPVPRSGPLNGFLVADLTFVGNEGWALGTVGCTDGSGRCTALAHSTDGGRRWQSIKPPAVNVAVPDVGAQCAAPCVTSVRFATPLVGYVFGGGDNGALLMTTDGGHRWQAQAGDAAALESLDGNVIRVADNGGCPPGCTYTVLTGGIGSARWTKMRLPGGTVSSTTGVTLARTGSAAYLITFGHVAGGAENARSTLWTSRDDGGHWVNRGEPCPQGPNEVDAVALTPAPDGSVTVLCQDRVTSGKFVAVSTDGGAHFVAGRKGALGAAPTVIGAGDAKNLFASSDDTYRSTDGGRHFARLGAQGSTSPGALGWLGFSSATDAHGISIDRRTIWLTTDGGQNWRAGRLR